MLPTKNMQLQLIWKFDQKFWLQLPQLLIKTILWSDLHYLLSPSLCKLISDHLYSFELKQLYRYDNLAVKISDLNSKTNTFHLRVRTNTNNHRKLDVKITDDLVIFSSKARAYAGETEVQTNAALLLFSALIHTPLSRTPFFLPTLSLSYPTFPGT